MASHTDEVTQLLEEYRSGDQRALDRLVPLVYRELRGLARRALRQERPGHTLNTTALVHEAYLKLVDQRRTNWRHKAQFLMVAAQIMRRVLVDHARGRATQKRGGGFRRTALPATGGVATPKSPDLVALDDAMTGLAEFDPHQARIVELRFFAGLTIEETADVLGASPATIKREWTLAKTWLRQQMNAGTSPGGSAGGSTL